MGYGSWSSINRKISEILNQEENPIPKLIEFFQENQDGMIAFSLGEQYQQKGVYEEALEWFKKAESLFPLPKYKEWARNRIREVEEKINLSSTKSENTLAVVSCTKRKIWDVEKDEKRTYVPAEEAYRGDDFIWWCSIAPKVKCRWLILSAKYGFIEPDHPISNYDVTFSDPHTGPISDESLIHQVKYQTRWKDNIPLKSFKKVFVFGSDIYYFKVKLAFSSAKAEVKKIKREDVERLLIWS